MYMCHFNKIEGINEIINVFDVVDENIVEVDEDGGICERCGEDLELVENSWWLCVDCCDDVIVE